MTKLCTVLLLLVLFANASAQDTAATNYVEAYVPAYTLPNVLKTLSHQTVRNKAAWEKVRRPEIVKLFEDNIYGQMPKKYVSIKHAVLREDKQAMNGKANLKEVAITVNNQNKSLTINLVLFVPKRVKRPVPVFLLINHRGKENTDPTRMIKSDFWPAEAIVDSGYAAAAIHINDLAPDDKITYVNGVLQLYPAPRAADNDMKAIGAWAWGASRAMDYFETDKDLDAKKIGVVGHSRGGKAALWAAAEDQRFAICFTNCSGNTGAALAKRQFGERIHNINTSFPHWFSNNYTKFNKRENDLPVDQHMLIALMAPRPVYATNASKDLWADPTGTFLSLKNAEDVYALYGKKSALPATPPTLNKPLIQSIIGYHNREGEHDLTAYDWNQFIKFSNYHFRQKGRGQQRKN